MLTPGSIKHVFVLMLENHSFDQLLGFSGITGTDPSNGQPRTIVPPAGSNSYGGTTYDVHGSGLNPMPLDPGHDFPDVVEQLCGAGATYPPGGPYPPIHGTGFAASYAGQPGFPKAAGASPGDPLGCFAPAQVPVITALAREFVLCDAWYSSMPGPTWPNRFFVHAASSGGLDHAPSIEDIAFYLTFGYTFAAGTIFDQLERQRRPWRIYHGDLTPQAFSLRHMTECFLEGHYRDFSDFAGDLAGDYDAAYTFIEPSYGAFWSTYRCGSSQHPLDDVTRGEWLVKCVYEAIRRSPVWESSLLVVTWDEHGGCYDSAVPPPAPKPGDVPTWPRNNRSRFAFDRLGVRVPAVVVSPWIPPNLIDSTTYDHTSVLATLERLWSIPALTQRDAAAQDLRWLGTLSAPRQDAPMTLPDPAPGLTEGWCGPVTDCSGLPGGLADAETLAATTPAPDEPLHVTQAGFLHAAHRLDVAVSSPVEHAERRARALAVRTKEDLRRYVHEVVRRARAARG